MKLKSLLVAGFLSFSALAGSSAHAFWVACGPNSCGLCCWGSGSCPFDEDDCVIDMIAVKTPSSLDPKEKVRCEEKIRARGVKTTIGRIPKATAKQITALKREFSPAAVAKPRP